MATTSPLSLRASRSFGHGCPGRVLLWLRCLAYGAASEAYPTLRIGRTERPAHWTAGGVRCLGQGLAGRRPQRAVVAEERRARGRGLGGSGGDSRSRGDVRMRDGGPGRSAPLLSFGLPPGRGGHGRVGVVGEAGRDLSCARGRLRQRGPQAGGDEVAPGLRLVPLQELRELLLRARPDLLVAGAPRWRWPQCCSAASRRIKRAGSPSATATSTSTRQTARA